MHPYRVFICYAHEDRALARKLEQALWDLDLKPDYDPHLAPGASFPEALKNKIAHSHLFIPLITENSKIRPWVQQETGYALALNVPVLPLAVGTDPGEMIADIEALQCPADASVTEIAKCLEAAGLEELISPTPAMPRALVEIADSSEDRTRMLADYVSQFLKCPTTGPLLQRAAFSSLSLSDAEEIDPIWDRCDGKIKGSQYLHRWQRQERLTLEAYSTRAGCRLIIDPSFEWRGNSPKARRTRLKILRDALAKLRDSGVEIEVLTSDAARGGNLTILGDWFVAESLAPRPGGYRQTVFNWHAPTVLTTVRAFEKQFASLSDQAAAGAPGLVGPDVTAVIDHLHGILSTRPTKKGRAKTKGSS